MSEKREVLDLSRGETCSAVGVFELGNTAVIVECGLKPHAGDGAMKHVATHSLEGDREITYLWALDMVKKANQVRRGG